MKGSVIDIIYFFAIILILGLILVVNQAFLSGVNDVFQASDAATNASKDFMAAGVSKMLIWDQGIILLMGLLFIVVLIAGAMLNTHPMFFIGSLLLLIIMIIVIPQVANMVLLAFENPHLVSFANQFPLTVQLYQNMPTIGLLYAAVLFVVTYAFRARRVSNEGFG